MKILIIALPRTGSTSLGETMRKKYNIKKYLFEPFNPLSIGIERYNSNENNIVVKTLVFQSLDEIKQEDRIEWLINLTKEFDEVILLSRKDLKACGESWAYLNYYHDMKKFMFYENYLWKTTPHDQWRYEQVLSYHTDLEFISKSINIPITYYEDIFDLNGPGRLRKGNSPTNKTII
jgi:hypothetical protein